MPRIFVKLEVFQLLSALIFVRLESPENIKLISVTLEVSQLLSASKLVRAFVPENI